MTPIIQTNHTPLNPCSNLLKNNLNTHISSLNPQNEDFNIKDFTPKFLTHLFTKIVPKERESEIMMYLKESLKNLRLTQEDSSSWLQMFNFCLDYISKRLDSIYALEDGRKELENSIKENPLIIEVIIEKTSKI